MTKLIIGITGGSASGKSTYAKNLKKFINFFDNKLKTIIISMDNFYKGLSSFTKEEKELFDKNELDFDKPSIIDFPSLIKLMKNLKNNIPSSMPIYERMKYDVTSEIILNEEYDVIIVEGIFILNNEELKDILDISIFIDIPNEYRIERRLKRYKENQLKEQKEYYNNFVVPSYEKYILPQKAKVDFIVDGNSNFISTLDYKLLNKIFNLI